MNTKSWKDIAELVGIAAIVASLIFVGVQLKLDRDTALAAGITEQNSSYQYWAELINDNADVWERGLSGAQLSNVEAVRFKALADAYEMHYVAAFERSRFVGGNPPVRYATQWALNINRNPGLSNYWRDSAQSMDEVHELSGYDEDSAPHDDSIWQRTVNEQLRKIEERSSK